MIRVTELLRWAGVTSPFPDTPAMRAALTRGTAVHEASVEIEQRVVTGTAKTYLMTLPDTLRGYAEAVSQFADDFRPAWDEVEVQKQDHVIGLSGTPDRVGLIRGERVVLDYKTGGASGWHRLQLALYTILVERCGVNGDDGYRIDKRLNVYLSKGGGYQVRTHRSQQDIIEAWKIINSFKERLPNE